MVWGWTEALSPMDWLLVSVFLGTVAWMIYRPQRLRREARHEEGPEILQSFPVMEKAAVRERQAEIKLHEWEREVDGRMKTRLAVLDQLILDADQKIEMLKKTLAELQSGATSRGNGEIVVFPVSGNPTSASTPQIRVNGETAGPHADAA